MSNLEEIINKVAKNIKRGSYPSLSEEDSAMIREYYTSKIPEGLVITGANVPLYTKLGTMIATGYERIVVGDYGAYIEYTKDQCVRENTGVKKGEEYRSTDKYKDNVKYYWWTSRDNSNVKIYYQRRTVSYADYKVGMLYVSVDEVKLTDDKPVNRPPVTENVKPPIDIQVMLMNVDLKNGKYHKAAFTGHRPDKIGGYERKNPTRVMIKDKIKSICEYLFNNCESTDFIAGGALGIDQDAADVILSMIDEFTAESTNKITPEELEMRRPKLHIAVPFAGQEDKWVEENKLYYRDQCAKADNIIYLYEEKPGSYSRICKALNERNEYMVNECDILIATWDGTAGGTANCIEYAKKVGKPIILLKISKAA